MRSLARLMLAGCVLLGIFEPVFVAAQPAVWTSRGPGGGGALFSPSISPHNSSDVYIACDMSELFHSTNWGVTWAPLDFREMVGNHGAEVQFTSSATTMYCINMENDLRTPMRSTDGGTVWSALAADPTGQDAWSLWADPASTNNLIVSDYTRMWHSNNGGASWSLRYTDATGNGCHIAGVFWDGANIYVGTNAGLLVSINSGASFAFSAATGIGAGQAMVSMTGAKVGAVTRLFCVTLGSGDVYTGITGADFWGYQSVYSLDVGGNWIARTTGIRTTVGDAHYPYFISMARNNIATAWLAGGSDAGVPIVYRTTDAGANWTSVLLTTNNQNIFTGWMGHQGDRNWGYPEYALGFAVAPLDATRAIITDLGMAHVTGDGGATWHQAYDDPADEHAMNSATPKNLYYHTSGLENTSCWWMTWSGANDVFAGFSDIRGVRSQSAGVTWGFNYTLHTQNTMYHIAKSGGGTLYGSASTAHDMYQSTYLTDARIDGADGEIRFSADSGATWPLLHDFANPVIWSAIDPTNTNRMFASVIDSAVGDVYITTNLNLGAGSTWTRCGTPPRTQGHPFNVHVLNDGTVVATYSGRRDAGGVFTNSSGVFVSTNNGTSWADRSHAGMLYWTKDLVIDPHDATQNTWYACVWSGWGGLPNGLGGLYRTTNRGMNWTRINSLDRVSSITIHPVNAGEAYLTTETTGLFRTTNLGAVTPTFTSLTTYPFRQPERVFFNPFNVNEIWVTSFGHGMRVGSTSAGTPTPTATASASPTRTPTASPTRSPTASPTRTPTLSPTASPTGSPTAPPTSSPTRSPTASPTRTPTLSPTASPTRSPTASPTATPTSSPTRSPTVSATASPTFSPTPGPTGSPTASPTRSPTASPTRSPTRSPTATVTPSGTPSPTASPSGSPTASPTESPSPTLSPSPTESPTPSPSLTPNAAGSWEIYE